MLEGPSYLISRDLPSLCEQERKWAYNKYHVLELSNKNYYLEREEEPRFIKAEGQREWVDLNLSVLLPYQHDCQHHAGCQLCSKKRCLESWDEPALRKSCKIEDAALEGRKKELRSLHDPSVGPADRHHVADQLDSENCSLLDEEESSGRKLSKIQDGALEEEKEEDDLHDLSAAQADQQENRRYAGDQSDSSSLIRQLGRDLSIECLLCCKRSDYGSLASLNQSFRSLIQSGELYRIRRQRGIVEHWIYFSCSLLEWKAYDPNCGRWMHLPGMAPNDCFMGSDKESLAVGTEVLVFGKETTSQIIYRYSILTNTWSSGMEMNTPRCLFGSASLGEIAILAGGCDLHGNICNSVELYNSETRTWFPLPSMNKARKMCSAVFIGRKFYVIGGTGVGNAILTCGEVYDLDARTWSEIPNMFPRRNEAGAIEAPPLVAVVNNVLYAADGTQKDVRRYNKERNTWITVGKLPERVVSMNGWGLAFRACRDQLIVIGGQRNPAGGMVELYSWVPNEGPLQWNLLAHRQLGSFVYNCAVMGC